MIYQKLTKTLQYTAGIGAFITTTIPMRSHTKYYNWLTNASGECLHWFFFHQHHKGFLWTQNTKNIVVKYRGAFITATIWLTSPKKLQNLHWTDWNMLRQRNASIGAFITRKTFLGMLVPPKTFIASTWNELSKHVLSLYFPFSLWYLPSWYRYMNTAQPI